MSNPEAAPAEIACTASQGGPIEVLHPREVPLGGPRAILVRRTLPQRHRSLVGAWCFADHYGPDDVRVSHGMDVPPHPHTGQQTVSWLFSGEIVEYRRLWEDRDARFGAVDGYTGSLQRMPAPPLPTTRLRPRPATVRKE